MIAEDDRTKSSLSGIITSKVKKESILFTDCWKGYSEINTIGYDHQKANHSIHFVDNQTNTHTNTIEGNLCAIKMQVTLRGRTKTLKNLFLVRFMLLRNEEEHPLRAIIKYLF